MDELRRARRVASIVLVGLGMATIVHGARAEDAAPGTDDGTAPAVGFTPDLTGAPAASGGLGPIAPPTSVLPATGVGAAGPDMRLGTGGLDSQSSGRPLQRTGQAWTITPSIGVTEEYVTGAQGTGGRGNGALGNQWITVLQPAILATGDTDRLQGTVSYNPQISFYVPDGNENRTAQDFNARLLVTLVPETLFLDVRGSGQEQAITPGQAPNQTNALGRGNTAQSYNFSASPYALHRFGDFGTGEIGGTIARSDQNALQPATNAPSVGNLAAATANQNVTISSAHVAFVTGEAFLRYNGTGLAQTTDFSGTGVLNGAYRDTVTLDNGYALTHEITALATVGWEDIHYAGTSPVHIDDGVWNFGIRVDPNPDSTITVRYGHRDGFDSFTLNAVYRPTARTQIFARSSTGLTTQAEQLQNALATSDLDSLGNPVDHTTGAPLVPVGNFFGSQNNLYKTTLNSLTGIVRFDRDTLSASVTSQVQTLVSASSTPAQAAGSTRGVYGTFTWSHQLLPNLQSMLYLQYGRTRDEGVITTSQNLVVVLASLAYQLSETLSVRAQYSYSQNYGDTQTYGNVTGPQNLFLLTVTKTF
jgi:uncharacterized protein (PEP-CTERM system associated)